MSLIVTEEQTYALTAISPLGELRKDAADESFGDSFPAELWLGNNLEFSAQVTSFKEQPQPEGAPSIIEMEGIIEQQFNDKGDDDHLWDELPQPTGFRVRFPATSTPTEYFDKVEVEGQATLFPLSA